MPVEMKSHHTSNSTSMMSCVVVKNTSFVALAATVTGLLLVSQNG